MAKVDDNRHHIALKLAIYLDASTTAPLPTSRINVLYEKFANTRIRCLNIIYAIVFDDWIVMILW